MGLTAKSLATRVTKETDSTDRIKAPDGFGSRADNRPGEIIMLSRSSAQKSARFVALFRRAHTHVANLQKVEEQLALLADQRQQTLDELRLAQEQINEEFERLYAAERIIGSEAAPTPPQSQPVEMPTTPRTMAGESFGFAEARRPMPGPLPMATMRAVAS
jgi:hypothetical protein